MIGGPEDDDPALKAMVKVCFLIWLDCFKFDNEVLQNMLTMYMAYRQMIEKQVNKAPKRLIFYRGAWMNGAM